MRSDEFPGTVPGTVDTVVHKADWVTPTELFPETGPVSGEQHTQCVWRGTPPQRGPLFVAIIVFCFPDGGKEGLEELNDSPNSHN